VNTIWVSFEAMIAEKTLKEEMNYIKVFSR